MMLFCTRNRGRIPLQQHNLELCHAKIVYNRSLQTHEATQRGRNLVLKLTRILSRLKTILQTSNSNSLKVVPARQSYCKKSKWSRDERIEERVESWGQFCLWTLPLKRFTENGIDAKEIGDAPFEPIHAGIL